MTNIVSNIVMILDKSGSMSNIRNDIIGSVNQFISDQRKVNDASFTFVTFSDNVETKFFKQPISSAKNITDSDYQTTGSTALYDAIGLTITKFEHDKNVLMVIVTDGQENASKKFNRKEVFDMVNKHKGVNGWNFIYLSADIDTFDQGTGVGFGSNSMWGNASGCTNAAVGYKSLSKGIAEQCNATVQNIRDQQRVTTKTTTTTTTTTAPKSFFGLF